MKGPQSYIFETIVRVTFFLVNVFAVYLLLRGHNLPGGGFIAGLASAISLVLLSFALGLGSLSAIIRIDPTRIAALGLMISLVSGTASIFFGEAFLQHFNFHWEKVPVFGELHVGTPLVFDIGVYLVVIGVTAKIIFILAKSTQGLRTMLKEEQQRYSSIMEQPIEGEQIEPEAKERKH